MAVPSSWQAIEEGWLAKEQEGWLKIRGSELGYCIRRQILGQMDMPRKQTPGKLNQAYEASTQFEQIVLFWLRDLGYTITDCQRPFSWSFFDLKAFIALHPDGINKVRSTPTSVVEIKSFGPSFYDKFLRQGLKGFPEYAWQLSAEMFATELPGMLVIANKQGTVNDLIIEDFAQPPCSREEIRSRVAEIRDTYDHYKNFTAIPAEWSCDPGVNNWGCPFWHLGKCPKGEAVYQGDLAGEINEAVEGLVSARLWKTESATDEARYREELGILLSRIAETRIVTNDYIVTFEPPRVTETFDLAKLKAKDPNLYEQLRSSYAKSSTRKATVRVTERKTGDG